MTVDHSLQCKKSGLITICHNNVADDWSALCASALTPLDIVHKPLMNYGGQQMVTGATVVEPKEEEKERRKEEESRGDNKNLTDTEKEEWGDNGMHSFR